MDHNSISVFIVFNDKIYDYRSVIHWYCHYIVLRQDRWR